MSKDNKKTISEMNGCASSGVVGAGGPFTRNVRRRRSTNESAPFKTVEEMKVKLAPKKKKKGGFGSNCL